MSNVFVTGATSFLGRHLIEKLIQKEDNLFCLVRKTSDVSSLPPQTNLCRADITDYASLDKAIPSQIDFVFHCAGYVRNDDKQKLQSVNVTGTENICRCALARKVKRLIHVSSVSVVAGNPVTLLTESLPYHAVSAYGASKIAAELRVQSYRSQGLPAAIIRPCIMYGQNSPRSLKFLLSLLNWRMLPLVSTGKNKIHWAYVKTVVDTMIYAATHDSFLQGTFFVADKTALSASEFVEILSRAVPHPGVKKIPKAVASAILKLPIFGQKCELLWSDRQYDISKLLTTGFTHRYETASALARVCKNVERNQPRRYASLQSGST